jgi:RNA methyltransferase, TrmH family
MISKQKVKYIQSLQHKKFRDADKVFTAEGPKLVTEFLQENIFECVELFCTKNWKLNNVLSNDLNVFTVEEYELQKISGLATANEVLAIFKQPLHVKLADVNSNISLVLQDIQDPGNLGTIIRTADWFGIKNIVCSLATVDCYSPKVVQSTMASLGRVNILYTDVVSFLNENIAIPSYAAILNGKNVSAIGKINNGFIILGNESKGIPAEIADSATHKISIARVGEAESLNVAVAASIILYALV